MKSKLDIAPRQRNYDSTYCRWSKQAYGEQSANIELLNAARRDWESLREFRERTRRAIRYLDGRQWEDYVPDPRVKAGGGYVMEKNLLLAQKKIPMVQNVIASIVNNLLGQYRLSSDSTVVFVRDANNANKEEALSDILASIKGANQLEEIDAISLLQHLVSGAFAQHISFTYFPKYDRPDVLVENVNYERVWFNADVEDIRLNDMCRVGLMHDMNLDKLLSAFARTSAEELYLRDYFQANTCEVSSMNYLSGEDTQGEDFLFPRYDNTRVRVFECWYVTNARAIIIDDPATGRFGKTDMTVEEIDAENSTRIANARAANNAEVARVAQWNAAHPEQPMQPSLIPLESVKLIGYTSRCEPEWNVKYLLADGTCLLQSKNPYAHQETPFELRLWPMIFGNVYGLVHQLIDQQRMINRMIILWDMIIGAGAKGVLLVPKDCIPVEDGVTLQDFADAWVEFDSVIAYKPSTKHNQVPQQVTANSVPVGVPEMLQQQMQLIHDISGVHSAIQGKPAASGVSGTLYQQQAENSSINSRNIFSVFSAFKEARDRKIIKVALQYYNGSIRIPSVKNGNVYTVDVGAIRNLDFDVKVIQNSDAPSYRQGVERQLMELVSRQIIPVDPYLMSSKDPTIKQVYENMKQLQSQAQQGLQNGDMQQLQAAAQQGNPQAMQLLQQAMEVKN